MIRISDAEYEVMKVIWKKKGLTSLEIIEELKGYKWNSNTIRTLIKRLQLKGAIKTSGAKEKMHTYVAVVDEKEYKMEITRDLLKKLYNNSISEFVLDYCEECKVTAEDLQEVMDYMKEKKKKESEDKK